MEKQDWKTRMVEEYIQLHERYEKLRAFNNRREVEGYFTDYNEPHTPEEKKSARKELHVTELMNKKPTAAAPDNVNHPSHYETNGVECIVAMEAAQGVGAVQDFCICNAFKYIWRHKHKNGAEDIRKAVWYLNKWLELNGKREVLTNETD